MLLLRDCRCYIKWNSTFSLFIQVLITVKYGLYSVKVVDNKKQCKRAKGSNHYITYMNVTH
jgi:hypothetical protein